MPSASPTPEPAQEALRAQVAAAAQQVRAFSQTLGDSDSATIAARANLDALKTEYRASVQEVKKLAGQNTALQKSTQSAADAVSTANVNLNNARAAVRSTQAEITRCNQSLRLAQTNWDAAGRSIDESRAAIATFGKQIALAESRFKLATVGIKELDTSVTGLAAKQTLLTEKLDLQRRSLAQYEVALAGAKEQLKAAQQANDPEKIRQANDAVIDAETALNRAKTAVATTRSEIEKTNQLLATAKSAWTAAGKSLEEFRQKVRRGRQGPDHRGPRADHHRDHARAGPGARRPSRRRWTLSPPSPACARLWTPPRRNLTRWPRPPRPCPRKLPPPPARSTRSWPPQASWASTRTIWRISPAP